MCKSCHLVAFPQSRPTLDTYIPTVVYACFTYQLSCDWFEIDVCSFIFNTIVLFRALYMTICNHPEDRTWTRISLDVVVAMKYNFYRSKQESNSQPYPSQARRFLRAMTQSSQRCTAVVNIPNKTYYFENTASIYLTNKLSGWLRSIKAITVSNWGTWRIPAEI